MASRYYSSVAAVTTLSNGVSPSGTSFIVGSTSGFPVQTPFTLLIDEGTQSEEIVTVTNVAGTTLTVTRGEDGTVAVAHDPGARVRHAMTARDLRESREHEAATTNVHGITNTASLATKTGVETLTNKTLASPSITGTVPGTTAFAGVRDTGLPAHQSWASGLTSIAATSFAAVPSSPTLSMTLARPTYLQITVQAWVTATGATNAELRLATFATGANTLTPPTTEPADSPDINWGGVIRAINVSGQQMSSVAHLYAAAGTTNFTLQAYKIGTGTTYSTDYIAWNIVPIRSL